ncbi:MAG: GldL-related protein [Chitinophagales bacterium]
MEQGLYILSLLLAFAEFYLINLMVRNGNILKGKYYRYIFIGLSIIIIGALFKILHFPYADQMLITGCCVVAIAYILWTFYKRPTYFLDILKCLWLLTTITAILIRFLHFPYSEYLITSNFAIFITMTFVYFKYPHQRHTGAMKERENDNTPIDQV